MGQIKVMFAFMPFSFIGILITLPVIALMDSRANWQETLILIAISLALIVPTHWWTFRLYKRIRRWPSYKEKWGYTRGTWLAAIPCSYLVGVLVVSLPLLLDN